MRTEVGGVVAERQGIGVGGGGGGEGGRGKRER